MRKSILNKLTESIVRQVILESNNASINQRIINYVMSLLNSVKWMPGDIKTRIKQKITNINPISYLEGFDFNNGIDKVAKQLRKLIPVNTLLKYKNSSDSSIINAFVSIGLSNYLAQNILKVIRRL